MNKPATFIATLLLAVASTAAAAPYAPEEHDFSELCGTVEAVREVAVRREPAELADVLEHAVQPETRELLIVRLDTGRVIAVLQDGPLGLRRGERVRFLGGRVSRT